MTWREKLVIRVLLLVARIVAAGGGSPELADEIKQLANHIEVHAPKPDTAG